ncbi:hypothetical protein FP2506_02045 [Fulvimarina pelagi HTCC2506]|uniref:Uncharacterized protein n=1 Tax=Fulvimarina pelagi HTCC2506 TaxID=314231 RepID=Q0FYL1_9HYPH|nr:hypothetical protein [Fulvimarina pelagi]EAU39984.1 hypothetical protein FP2506_02045 [Fulvimarina pelagi HTCC2506]
MSSDRRLGRIGVKADFLFAPVDETDDITRHEIQRRAAEEYRLEVGVGTL